MRPSSNDSTVTTPRAGAMIRLLGSQRFGSIAFSPDEFRAIQTLYGFTPEGPTPKPDPPVAPQPANFDAVYKYEAALRDYERELKRHENWQDPRVLLQAGADRNAVRHAEADGLRLLAWFAKFVPAGEDPLKHLVQIAADAGLAVDPEDFEWASEP